MNSKNNRTINAVIFDMDGTMIDTEEIKEILYAKLDSLVEVIKLVQNKKI